MTAAKKPSSLPVDSTNNYLQQLQQQSHALFNNHATNFAVGNHTHNHNHHHNQPVHPSHLELDLLGGLQHLDAPMLHSHIAHLLSPELDPELNANINITPSLHALTHGLFDLNAAQLPPLNIDGAAANSQSQSQQAPMTTPAFHGLRFGAATATANLNPNPADFSTMTAELMDGGLGHLSSWDAFAKIIEAQNYHQTQLQKDDAHAAAAAPLDVYTAAAAAAGFHMDEYAPLFGAYNSTATALSSEVPYGVKQETKKEADDLYHDTDEDVDDEEEDEDDDIPPAVIAIDDDCSNKENDEATSSANTSTNKKRKTRDDAAAAAADDDESVEPSVSSSSVSVSTSGIKRRKLNTGRARDVAATAVSTTTTTTVKKRKRGRPRKHPAKDEGKEKEKTKGKSKSVKKEKGKKRKKSASTSDDEAIDMEQYYGAQAGLESFVGIRTEDGEVRIQIPNKPSEDFPKVKYSVFGNACSDKIEDILQPKKRTRYVRGLSEEEKKSRRREQNRNAAARSRARKNAMISKVIQLHQENMGLRAFVAENIAQTKVLREEICRLNSYIMHQHQPQAQTQFLPPVAASASVHAPPETTTTATVMNGETPQHQQQQNHVDADVQAEEPLTRHSASLFDIINHDQVST